MLRSVMLMGVMLLFTTACWDKDQQTSLTPADETQVSEQTAEETNLETIQEATETKTDMPKAGEEVVDEETAQQRGTVPQAGQEEDVQ